MLGRRDERPGVPMHVHVHVQTPHCLRLPRPPPQTFHLCPLVASPCASADNSSQWRTVQVGGAPQRSPPLRVRTRARRVLMQGGVWASMGLPGVMINIDCDACGVGTHAKAMIEDSSPLTWNAASSQVKWV